MTMPFDDKQNEAIRLCLDTSQRIVGVTGEAGTGKTWIIKNVLDHFKEKGISYGASAPTGKASKRIQEATGHPATTIHSRLEYPRPGEIDEKTGKPLQSGEPKRDRQNPVDAKILCVDEYAMVNWEVHRNLLDALPSGGCIRVFGDVRQLAPIEEDKKRRSEPSPFQTLLAKFPSVTLETIHRQSEGSGIIFNGHRINNDQIPARKDDFQLLITEQPVLKIQDFVRTSIIDGVDFSKLENQIISPTRKGWTGTTKLNPVIQSIFQEGNRQYAILERHTWAEEDFCHVYLGDKVLFCVNNYDLGIFNGEVGIVLEIQSSGNVIVDFGDRIVDIPPLMEVDGKHGSKYVINPQKDLDLAYVITTHKMQGSECNHVCYILNKSSSFMQSRRNFYTAITRGSKKATVISDMKSLSFSVWKDYDGAKK